MRIAIGALPLHATVIGLVLVWVLPTVGLLVSSFRPPHLVSSTGWWTAFTAAPGFTLQNYEQVLTTNNMATSFVNSLMVTIPAVIIPIAIASFAAFAFAWMEFPFRNTIFLALVALLVVPLQMTLVPVLQLHTNLGLNGTSGHLARAHGLRTPVRDLPAAELLRFAPA